MKNRSAVVNQNTRYGISRVDFSLCFWFNFIQFFYSFFCAFSIFIHYLCLNKFFKNLRCFFSILFESSISTVSALRPFVIRILRLSSFFPRSSVFSRPSVFSGTTLFFLLHVSLTFSSNTPNIGLSVPTR